MSTHLTNLEILNSCANFPPNASPPEGTYTFHIPPLSQPLGYIPPSVAQAFSSHPEIFSVDSSNHTVTLVSPPDYHSRSKALMTIAQTLRDQGTFQVLKKWRDELVPIFGLHGEVLCAVERTFGPLLGTIGLGCHLSAYTYEKATSDESSKGEYKIWVARRSLTKQEYPGMLDSTAGGTLGVWEDPEDCMLREADEEASLDKELMRGKMKAVGIVSYVHRTDQRASSGDLRLFQPDTLFLYELDLTGHEVGIIRPNDGEVQGFELLTVKEVQDAMAKGEFKPNCAVVLLDFMIRHGILTVENEKDYVEICSKLRERLIYPGLSMTETYIQQRAQILKA